MPLPHYTRGVICLAYAMLAAQLGAQDAAPQAAGAHPTVRPQPAYLGAGSCNSSACHGGVQPRDRTAVLQNEYSTWITKDKHAQAYKVLSNPLSVRMGEILKLGTAPNEAAKCLACHSINVDEAHRADSFDQSDGVSCESCHGAAERWFAKHTEPGYGYDRVVRELGMYDTRNLVDRSNRCLSCHLGSAEKSVDHAMLAAGHPDLYFELDSFEAVMPRHWKYPPEGDSWTGIRTLAVGQAVQLRASLQRLCRRAGAENWPEYAELDCFSCHHSLTSGAQSWRQARGYNGRRPGDPPFNGSRYAVFRKLVDAFDPGASARLAAEMTQVYTQMSGLRPIRAQVIECATNASETASGVIRKLTAAQFDEAGALRLMRAIASDPESIVDERSAEQAAMALDSLYVGLRGNGKMNKPALESAIKSLFQDFENPSSYDPGVFAKKMREVDSLL